ncbi:MAG: TraR/DksA C4-type zinc finger protein [Sedimentisphaerales bacterium]
MAKKKADKGKLTPADIKEFKNLLLAKRNEILGNVTSMEDETLRRQRSDLSNMPIHMADIGTDNFDQEFTLGLMDSERKLLKEIDDALQRIEDGTYGICEGSGKPITKARLEAIPWARYCVEYAGLLEKGMIDKEYSSGGARYDYEIGNEDEEDDVSGESFRKAE